MADLNFYFAKLNVSGHIVTNLPVIAFWRKSVNSFCITALLIVTVSQLNAQIKPIRDANPVQNIPVDTSARDTSSKPLTAADDLLQDLFDNDSISVDYYINRNPFKLFPMDDSMLNRSMRMLDVGRRAMPEWQHLGNVGSPALQALYKPLHRGAFDVGLHQFDAYNITFDNFIIYRPKTPFTHVKYAMTTGVRDDNVFSGSLARQFAKNLTANVHYSRINQFGETVYDKTRNTNLGIGFNQSHFKNKLKTNLMYTFNQYFRQENGGIQSDTLLTQGGFAANTTNLPVFRDEAGSKVSDWGFLLSADYLITGKRDSTISRYSGQGLHIGYEVSYKRSKALYYDPSTNNVALDTSYYRGMNNDSRGLRNSLQHNTFRNEVYLSFTGKDSVAAGQSGSFLRAGVVYEQHKLTYSLLDTSFGVLMLAGQGQWELRKIAGISASGFYVLSSLEPIFDLKGSLTGRLGRTFDAEAWLQVRNLPLSYLNQHLILNGRDIFRTNGSNQFQTYLGGRITLPFLNLSGAIHQNLVSNYFYFNNEWQPTQESGVISVTGIEASHALKIGKFHFDNEVLWQISSSPNVRIPELLTNHALYLETKMIKQKLLINIGFDARLGSAYSRVGYSPLLFSFYNTNNPGSSFINYDFFLSYKVRLLRGFLRAENLNTFFDRSAYYQVDGYLQDRFAIRLGFDWMFNN